MGFKDQMAVMAAPIFLRLAIALTFLWAGLGKVTQSFEVSGADAAYLANMGAIDLTQLAGTKPAAIAPRDPTAVLSSALPAAAQVTLAQSGPPIAARTFTAADFASPVKATAAYRLSLLLRDAAEPGVDAKGNAKMRLWPAALTRGQWTRWLAFTVAWTETIGGALVFVGLFTRLWGFMLAGTMMGAIWLTLIGPTIHSGNTRFGFLPADLATFDMGWMKWFWVFGLLMSCLALMCAGAGAWSLDSLFRPAKSAPKPVAPKPPS